MSDERLSPHNSFDPLPPELERMHERLVADSARWVAGLPSTERLRRGLAHVVVEAGPPEIDEETGYAAYPHVFADATPRNGAGTMTRGRLRGLAASGAAVAVAGLLAAVLVSFGLHGGTQGVHTGKPTAKAAPIVMRHANAPAAGKRGQWVTLPGLTYTTQEMNSAGQIAIAPTNPQVVYEASSGPMQLRRTDDGGATWHSLPVPGFQTSPFDFEVFVSPLDEHVVFATITYATMPDPTANCPSIGSGGGSAAQQGGVWASGNPPCGLQYVSRDGGQHWTVLKLPEPGVLSGPIPLSALTNGAVLQAQGNRLYGFIGCGTVCAFAGNNLVTSVDGGLTWSATDNGIGGAECMFAAAPTGSTVFVVASTQSCDSEALPPLALWRSDDAGLHWQSVGALPSPMVRGMAAVSQPGSAQPLLYLNMPSASMGNHTTNVTWSPANVRVSADGGKTWKAAPMGGVPDQSDAINGPAGTLQDGSLVTFQIQGSCGATCPLSTKLYTWRRGAPTWRQLAPAVPSVAQEVIVTSYADGESAIWIVVPAGSASGTQQATYHVMVYLP